VTNTIAPGTDFVAHTGQVVMAATADLTCVPPPQPTNAPPSPVPALDDWRLALLALGLSLAGVAVLRRKAHR
jgi:hypothetical protein